MILDGFGILLARQNFIFLRFLLTLYIFVLWIPEANRCAARKEPLHRQVTPPEGFCHWVTLSANKPSVRKLGRKLAFPWLFQHGGISRKVIVSHCFILYCLILFGILGTEYFSKRRKEISIFKFSLAAQILGQRHTSDPNKWGWRAVAFFADLDLVHILQKVGGNVIRIQI